MNADDKYFPANRQFNATNSYAITKKQETFSQFFSRFLKFRLNFEHFQKRDNSHSRCICEISDS